MRQSIESIVVSNIESTKESSYFQDFQRPTGNCTFPHNKVVWADQNDKYLTLSGIITTPDGTTVLVLFRNTEWPLPFIPNYFLFFKGK